MTSTTVTGARETYRAKDLEGQDGEAVAVEYLQFSHNPEHLTTYRRNEKKRTTRSNQRSSEEEKEERLQQQQQQYCSVPGPSPLHSSVLLWNDAVHSTMGWGRRCGSTANARRELLSPTTDAAVMSGGQRFTEQYQQELLRLLESS